jgi:transposase-like protein
MRFKALPAVSEWSDFNDCHVEALCASLQTSLSVRVNIIQPKNGQDRFTAERVLRTRPKTYRAIVQLLADPGATVMHIARRHRVSEHTVRAIRQREAVAIAERKQRLMSIFGNVAEIAGERMEELAGQATLRDAGITAGIATDKLLALSSDPHANNYLHVHLQPVDLIGQFNEMLRKLQSSALKAKDTAAEALPSGPNKEATQPAEGCAREEKPAQKEFTHEGEI